MTGANRTPAVRCARPRLLIGGGAAVLALVLCPPPLAAQEGTPPGISSAREAADDDDDRIADVPDESLQGAGEPDSGDEPQAFQPEGAAGVGNLLAGRRIEFTANLLEYDSNGDIVTARGDVFLQAEDRSLRAETVVWDRQSGQITAQGDVRLVDENGNLLLSDSLELTDAFETGTIDNLLLALSQGGRVAAQQAARNADGTITLERAAYTACPVVGRDGEDVCPTWRITAEQVVYDPAANQAAFSRRDLSPVRTSRPAPAGPVDQHGRLGRVGLFHSGPAHWPQ